MNFCNLVARETAPKEKRYRLPACKKNEAKKKEKEKQNTPLQTHKLGPLKQFCAIFITNASIYIINNALSTKR